MAAQHETKFLVLLAFSLLVGCCKISISNTQQLVFLPRFLVNAKALASSGVIRRRLRELPRASCPGKCPRTRRVCLDSRAELRRGSFLALRIAAMTRGLRLPWMTAIIHSGFSFGAYAMR